MFTKTSCCSRELVATGHMPGIVVSPAAYLMLAVVAGDRGGCIQHLDFLMHLLHVVQKGLGRVQLGVRACWAGPIAGPLCLGPPHDHQALHHLPGYFPTMLTLDDCTTTTYFS